MIKSEKIKVANENNEFLSATLFIPKVHKGCVLIGPATGVKKEFYTWFAMYLAENNFVVLTFDNNGIGESLNQSIKKVKVNLQSWGESDMKWMIDYLKSQFPQHKIHLVGHSAGGQLVGLMDNYYELKSVFNYACSSGSIKNMHQPFKRKAKFFLNYFIPISNTCLGYTNSPKLGMGEPLPKNVAKQWSQWCNGSAYVKTAFGKTIHKHYYNDLKVPIYWVNAIDDDIANDKNVKEMASIFTACNHQFLTINPKDQNLKELGHMKFFSRQSSHLWYLTLDWINQHNN